MLTDKRPAEHFNDLVTEALHHQGVETNEFARFYLATLLVNFIEAGRFSSEPLARKYLEALNSGRAEKTWRFKQLGDLALFTSGFFSDSFSRKIIDVDYYILMGVASYGFLASIHGEDPRTDDNPPLYSELAGKFNLFVDVLNEVSERTRLTSPTNVLRLYERWLRTGSPRAERMLREMGIDPLDVDTNPLQ